jgi:hypothetical protein
MTSKTSVTFGQQHVHSVNNKTFDKDCVAVITAENHAEGRAKAFEYFGPKFCFTYFDDQFDDQKLSYFPRGLIYVDD